MSRSDRLLDLAHHLLSGRTERSVDDIAERLEVSRRTVYRDLATLESRRLVERGEDGYRLPVGSTKPVPLDARERAVLRLLLDLPALRRQASLRTLVDGVARKLDARAPAPPETPAITGPERSGPVEGAVLDRLQRSIRRGEPVELFYASLSRGERDWRAVDPYRVFHREGAWYLVGRCHLADQPRTFRLDRVEKARPVPGSFTPLASFDLDAYLEGTWGIWRGDEQVEVELDVDPALAPFLERARHHEGEEIERRADGGWTYRVRLSSIEEIARWVVGFGGRMRVAAPEALARRVVELAEGALREQGRPQPDKRPRQ